MKKETKKVTAWLLTAAMACSMAGCMPTKDDSVSTTAANVQTKAEGETTAAVSEPSATAEMEINTTDPITLRFNWWGGDSRHEKTLEAIKAFEAKYPNIKVQAEYEAFSGHEEKVALALNSGAGADVIQLNMDWVFTYSPKAETFVDLNTVSNIIDLSAYDDSDKEFYTIDGSLQALPIANTGRGFYWNKTTFDKVGVKIPVTLEELYEAGEKFAAYEDGSYYPFAVADYAKMHVMIYYLQCKYGKPWIEKNELQYSKEEIMEGLDFIKDLEDKHVMPGAEKLAGEGADLIETNQNWIEGKYAGSMVWDTNIAKFQEAVIDGECIVGDFIEMGDFHGGPIKASQVIAITSSTKYPAESAALIQFLFGEQEGVEILGDSRGVPCNKNAAKWLDLGDSQVADMNTKLLEWTTFKLDTITERSALKAADGVYTLTFQSLSYGVEDTETCAQTLMDGINKEIKSAISE